MTTFKPRIAFLFSLLLVMLLVFAPLALAEEAQNPNQDNLIQPYAGDVAINKTNFPDPDFFWWVNQQPWATDGVLSQAEAAAITSISVSSVGVSDLKGIEFFPELMYLECSDNYITHIDTSHNPKLEILNCNSYVPGPWPWDLVSINVTKNPNLYYLSCKGQALSSVDLSGNPALEILNLRENQLTSIDLSNNPLLRNVVVDNNQLTSIDVSYNKELSGLHCSYNKLTSLDLTQNTELHELMCIDNQLTVLDLSNNRKMYSYYVVFYDKQTSKTDVFSPDDGLTDYVDLASVVGKENLREITSVTGGIFDAATGLVQLNSPAPATLTYTYDVHCFDRAPMDVTLTLSSIDAPLYDVTFDSMGGSAVSKTTVAKAAKITKPGDPVKDGFQFEGWHTKSPEFLYLESVQDGSLTSLTSKIDIDGYIPWNFDTPVTSHMTLYAQWVAVDKIRPTDSAEKPVPATGLPATSDLLLPYAFAAMLATFFSAAFILVGLRRRWLN